MIWVGEAFPFLKELFLVKRVVELGEDVLSHDVLVSEAELLKNLIDGRAFRKKHRVESGWRFKFL